MTAAECFTLRHDRAWIGDAGARHEACCDVCGSQLPCLTAIGSLRVCYHVDCRTSALARMVVCHGVARSTHDARLFHGVAR